MCRDYIRAIFETQHNEKLRHFSTEDCKTPNCSSPVCLSSKHEHRATTASQSRKSFLDFVLKCGFLCLATMFFVLAETAQAQTCPDPLPQPTNDENVLTILFCTTGGLNWKDKNGWLTDPDLGNWKGVHLGTGGRVEFLDLGNNNLVGTIPAELGNLSHLKMLFLEINRLSGTIPTGLGNLSNLTDLQP